MYIITRKNHNIKAYIEGIKALEQRDDGFLHLSANENILSNTARQFLSSKLSGRYYFGIGKNGVVSKRALQAVGMEELDDLLAAANRAANTRLGSSAVSFNLLSGIHSMISAFLAVSDPGDTIMTLDNRFSGHFMTGSIFDRIGRKQVLAVHHRDSGAIDVEKTAEVFKSMNARALYLDMMSVIEKQPLEQLRGALGKDALVIFDASHTLGLIMGGQFQDPIKEGADIIVGNTHKTFPGPQKAMMAFRSKEVGERVMAIISKGLCSSVHTNNMIVLAITVLEMNEFGRDYALQVISNAKMLGAALERKGYLLRKTSRGEFSQNHQLHIFLENIPKTNKLPYNLYKNNISFTILNPPAGKPYLRFGAQEVTRKGMKEEDMEVIAAFIDDSIKGKDRAKEVTQFSNRFNKVHYSFDGLSC